MNKANNSTRTYVGTYVCTRMVFHTNHMFPIRYEVRVLLVKMFWLYHSLYFGKKKYIYSPHRNMFQTNVRLRKITRSCEI